MTTCRVVLAACALSTSANAAVTTFEDLTVPAIGFYNGADGASGFSSGGVQFNNTFTDFGGGFTGWDGFSYSNKTDSTTPGFVNQYSSIVGSGAGASPTYAVAFSNSAQISFSSAVSFAAGSAVITNTTYAALSMQNGDMFAKKFGGPTGNDPDFLKINIIGSLSGATTSTIEFYLADFRGGTGDFIITNWTNVDFSALGIVDKINFSFESSDTGDFGINTPTYFAIDNITFTPVPEPSAFVLGLLGSIMLIRRKRSQA